MSQNQQIEFEGSDDDIRARFEGYLTQLLSSVEYDFNTPANDPKNSKLQLSFVEKIDYISEYNSLWINSWKTLPCYKIWSDARSKDYLEMINPGHPCHGHSVLDSIAASFSAFGKTIVKEQGDSSITDNTVSSASQMFSSVSTWYSSKFKGSSDSPPTTNTGTATSTANEVAQELKRIQQLVNEAKEPPKSEIDEEYEHVVL